MRPVRTVLVVVVASAPAFTALLAAPPGLAADGPTTTTTRPAAPGGPTTGPAAGTVVDVETAPDNARSPEGTKAYDPAKREEPFYLRTPEAERAVGSVLDDKTGYDLAARRGKFVSWFGIVRVVRPLDGGRYELLLEHKYFDTLTDLHVLALSFNGAGDFKAVVTPKGAAVGKDGKEAKNAKDAKDAAGPDDVPIRRLMLVRVYGTVDGDGGKDDPPTV